MPDAFDCSAILAAVFCFKARIISLRRSASVGPIMIGSFQSNPREEDPPAAPRGESPETPAGFSLVESVWRFVEFMVSACLSTYERLDIGQPITGRYPMAWESHAGKYAVLCQVRDAPGRATQQPRRFNTAYETILGSRILLSIFFDQSGPRLSWQGSQ